MALLVRHGPWKTGKTLGPSIEINLPLDPNDRVTAGRSLVDEDRRLYLAIRAGWVEEEMAT